MVSPELNFEPIQEASVENHEKLLYNRILAIQLSYAERVSNGDIPFIDGEFKKMDFPEAVAKYTLVQRLARRAYMKKTGIYIERDLEIELENNKEFANFFNEVMQDIAKEREFVSDMNSLVLRLDETIANAADRLPRGEEPARDTLDEREDAGLITYQIRSGMKGLEKYGISIEDLCADIHIEAIFKQKASQENKKLSKADVESAFRQLAQNIMEQQNVKAVVGSSWLLDSKVASALGFRDLNPYKGEGFSEGYAFWGQIIDAEGQIKQEEVDKFLQTGKPKYRMMVGHIPIDEFLEKYGEK